MSQPIVEPMPASGKSDVSFAGLLAAERQRQGFSSADVAATLRVSVSLVEAMERGDWERLGARVYASGYMHSYAKLLGVPSIKVDAVVASLADPAPPLQSSNYIPRARFQAERYARRVASIVLTASIVVPVVWLATEQKLPVQPGSLQALDSVGSEVLLPTEPSIAEDFAMGPPESLAGVPPTPAARADQMEVVASFAPFLGTRPVAQSSDGWSLTFAGDSWVEVVSVSGDRLEYGIVRGGSQRHFESGQVARVALGNAAAVSVTLDGEAVDLSSFQRANVARFAVSSNGELTPTGG